MTTLAIDPTADLLRWRSDREDALRQPHGWLSLVGLYALTATPRSIPGCPGPVVDRRRPTRWSRPTPPTA